MKWCATINLLLAFILLCGLFSPSILPAFSEHQTLPPSIEEAPTVTESAAISSSDTGQEQRINLLGKLPLLFIENQGQLDSSVRYYAKGSGHTVYFTEDRVVFDYIRYLDDGNRARHEPGNEPAQQKAERLVFSLTFPGANAKPVITGEAEDSGKVNYLIGNDPSRWHTDLSTFREVVYHDVYPGIDLRFYGNSGMLEYDLLVKPGACVEDIRLAYDGVDRLSLVKGELVATTPFGEMKQSQPYVYQVLGDDRVTVPGSFRLAGDNGYGFAIASYDTGYPVVIDPGIRYSTYLGGTAADKAYDVDVNDSGIILTGETVSNDFPMASSYNGTYSGTKDIFVTKLAADGQSLVFSTYLGGNGADVGNAVCYGLSDQVIIGGETVSINFPCLYADQNNFCSQFDYWTDGTLTILNSAGNALVFSTYVGGSEVDTVEDVAFGHLDRIYVVGWTNSPRDNPFYEDPEYDFPVSLTAYQNDNAGSSDAFVLIYESDGDPRLASTFFGGTGADWGYGIASASGFPNYVYICGGTMSTNLPLLNEYQSSNRGNADAFVTAFYVLLDPIAYSTYLGSSGSDGAYSIAVKSQNEPYDIVVTGEAGGGATPFPNLNAYQGSYGGNTDAFVAHIDTEESGSASLKYSTYFGCAGTEKGNGITVDSNGKVHVAGEVGNQSVDCYCYQKNAFQPNRNNGAGGVSNDAFVAKFDLSQSGANSLLWSSYLGGSGNDWGEAVAQLNGCYTYVAGYTDSTTDFPITTNAYQTSYQGGTCDAFVTQISDSEIYIAIPSFNFGDVKVGNDSTWQTVHVYSTGTGPLICGTVSIAGTNPGDFATQSDNVSGATINPGDDRTIQVKFHPTTAGARSAILSIPNSDSDEDPKNITLSGTGTVPDIAINPTSHDFDTVIVGGSSTQIFTVSNTGTGSLVVTDNITILGTGFTIQNNNVGGATIPPNQTLQVVFSPTAPGAHSATLNIWSDDPDPSENPLQVPLSGTGLDAGISVSKWSENTVSKVGDNVTYWVTITNTGALALNTDNITDTKKGDITSRFSDPLASGATDNISYWYIVQGGDTDPLQNTVTAYYHPAGYPTLDVSGTANCTVDLVHPSISVTKTPDNTISKIGDNVTYTITINNTGDWPLIRDSISDNISVWPDPNTYGDFAYIPASTLVSGNFTHTVQFSDPDPLGNMVIVNYHPEGLPNDISANATCAVDLVHPGIEVTKEPDNTISKIGDNVTFTITIENTGDWPLIRYSVSDNLSVSPDPNTYADFASIPAYSSVSGNFTYTVQITDPDPLPNMVIVNYHPDGLPNNISANATCTVDLVHPDLTISKTADNTISKVTDTITYTITVGNPGDWPLEKVSVTDSLGVPITGLSDTLAVGTSENVSYSYTVTGGDLDPLENTVTAQYRPVGLSNDIIRQANHSVDLVHPDILVVKGVVAGIYRAGDIIMYFVAIKNTSTDITLVKDSVTDSLAGDITSLFSDNITAGGSEATTYTYTVKSTDPDPLVNLVTVHYHPQGLLNDITDNTDNTTCSIDLAPTITSVVPNEGTQGQTLNIVITGSQLERVTDVSFLLGSGVHVNSFTPGPAQITANIGIDADATLGLKTIQVTNSVDTATLPDAFTVKQLPQSVATGTGTGTATFTTSNGSITTLTAATTTPCGTLVGYTFPHGFFSFTITGITPGSTVTITITLPGNVPAGTQYWKCINGQWVDCTSLLGSNDGDNIITLTIQDGGLGDADGAANGTIVDPGGPAVKVSQAQTLPSSRRVSPPLSTSPRMPRPAQIQLQYLSINPQQATAGQPVTILTNVVNTGDEAGSYNVVLKINGQMEQSRMVSVGPQGTQPVKFTLTKAQPGTYTVNIDDQKRSFTVTGAGSSPNGRMGEGLLFAVAMAVIVILVGLLIVVARRRFQGY